MAILCRAGLLSPARLDRCGKGAWHAVVAAAAGVRCGFITTGDGDGTGDGGEVTALAGVMSVAVGTESLAEDKAAPAEEEDSLGGMEGGI